MQGPAFLDLDLRRLPLLSSFTLYVLSIYPHFWSISIDNP